VSEGLRHVVAGVRPGRDVLIRTNLILFSRIIGSLDPGTNVSGNRLNDLIYMFWRAYCAICPNPARDSSH
jgi:hypothetical protein